LDVARCLAFVVASVALDFVRWGGWDEGDVEVEWRDEMKGEDELSSEVGWEEKKSRLTDW